MNILVADTVHRARFLIEELGLNSEEWLAAAPGCAFAGRCFDKVVDVTSTPESEKEAERWSAWFKHLYGCKIKR